MTTSDPFYSLNVFFSNIAFAEMVFLNKMQWECESDLYNARITESTSSVNILSRKETLDLHMKMLEQNLHSIKNRAMSNWTQDSEAGDWSQADAMTQRLQVDFEYLLLRTKDLSARYDQGFSTVMHCATTEETRKAISQTLRFINLLRLCFSYTQPSVLIYLLGMNMSGWRTKNNNNFTLLYMVVVALFVANLGLLLLVGTDSIFSHFLSYVIAYIERKIDSGRHHRGGAPGRTRASTGTKVIGEDRGRIEWIVTSSQRSQAVHKTNEASKSECVVSSTSEDGREAFENLLTYSGCFRTTMDVMLALNMAMMCVAVVSLFTAISRGHTASISPAELRDVYYCVDLLFSAGGGCYRVSSPSPKWYSMWVNSSLQYSGALLLSFCLTRLTFLAKKDIKALMLCLRNSSLSKQMKLRCQELQAFARLRDIRARGFLSTGALAERLGLREAPIEDGMKRVRWTCVSVHFASLDLNFRPMAKRGGSLQLGPLSISQQRSDMFNSL